MKSLKEICKSNEKAYEWFANGGDLSTKLYLELYEYYVSNGEMPYGVAKARTGDPLQWIMDRLEKDMEIHE
jgi:hypothetical protein